MTPRPGRVAGIVDIDLPQPRVFETREETKYFDKLVEVREVLRAEEE